MVGRKHVINTSAQQFCLKQYGTICTLRQISDGREGRILKRTYPLLLTAALGLLTGQAGLAQTVPASSAAPLAAAAEPLPAPRPMAGLSPDGAWLAIADGEGRVSVNALNQAHTARDLPDIAPVSTRLSDVSKWLAVGFSPDGRRLAILVQNGQSDIRLLLWDIGQGVAGGYTLPLQINSLKDFRTPTFSPDGTRLIVGDYREDDLLINASNGQVIAHIGRTNAHAFSANGQYLIAITSDERAAEIRTAQDGQLVKRLETGADTHDAVFLDNLRIAAFRWNCAVMQASLTENQAAIHEIVPPDDNCSFPKLSADGRHMLADLGPSGHSALVVTDLSNGRRVSEAGGAGLSDGTVTDGLLVVDRDDRPVVRPLTGETFVSLPVSWAAYSGTTQSLTVANGRLLTHDRDNVIRVTDLHNGRDLFCQDGQIDCRTALVRARLEQAQADARPEGLIETLSQPDSTKAALGPLWPGSRLDLAHAYLVLGNLDSARSVLEAAQELPQAEYRLRASTALAELLIDQAEPARASAILAATTEDLLRLGASLQTGQLTVLRKSNGLRIELAPVDLPYVAGIIAAAPDKPAASASGRVVEIGEDEYSALREAIGGLGSAPFEAGFADGLRISSRRLDLFRILAQVHFLQARMLLSGAVGGNAQPGDRAVAAIAQLDRLGGYLDGKGSPLTVLERAKRQDLRADALSQLGDEQASLRARKEALAIVNMKEAPDPVLRASLLGRIGRSQTRLGLAAEADGSRNEAEQALRGQVPDDNLDLLSLSGANSLAKLRAGQDKPGNLAALNRTIDLARRHIAASSAERGSDAAIGLRNLFAAGLEGTWLTYGSPSPVSARAPTADLSPPVRSRPLEIGPVPRSKVLQMSFAEDGKILKFRDYYRAFDIDPVTGELLRSERITPDEAPSSQNVKLSVAFDGDRREAHYEVGKVVIADVATDHQIIIPLAEVPSALAPSPDGRRLALGFAFSNDVRLFDTGSGRLLAQLVGHGAPVSSLAWSPDSAVVAAGSKEGAVLLFDPESRQILARFNDTISDLAHRSEIADIAFTPGSGGLLTLSAHLYETSGLNLRLWSLDGRRLERRLSTGRDDRILLNGADRQVMAMDSQGVDLFDLASASDVGTQPPARLAGEWSSYPDGLAETRVIRPGLAVGLRRVDGTDMLVGMDIAAGKEVWRWPAQKAAVQAIHTRPDGADGLMAVRWQDKVNDEDVGRLSLLSANEGRLICTVSFDGADKADLLGDLDPFAFSADGTLLFAAATNYDDAVPVDGPGARIMRALRIDARTCAIIADQDEKAARADTALLNAIYGGDPAPVVAAIGVDADKVRRIMYAPDGTSAFAQTTDNSIWFYRRGQTGAALCLAHATTRVRQIAFSPDGRHLIAVSGARIWSWNGLTGEMEGEFGK